MTETRAVNRVGGATKIIGRRINIIARAGEIIGGATYVAVRATTRVRGAGKLIGRDVKMENGLYCV